jgi:hypothetical protein
VVENVLAFKLGDLLFVELKAFLADCALSDVKRNLVARQFELR